jgi:hypothetical protein
MAENKISTQYLDILLCLSRSHYSNRQQTKQKFYFMGGGYYIHLYVTLYKYLLQTDNDVTEFHGARSLKDIMA